MFFFFFQCHIAGQSISSFGESECRKFGSGYIKKHPDKQAIENFVNFYCSPDTPSLKGKSYDQRFAMLAGDVSVVMPTVDRAFLHAGLMKILKLNAQKSVQFD